MWGMAGCLRHPAADPLFTQQHADVQEAWDDPVPCEPPQRAQSKVLPVAACTPQSRRHTPARSPHNASVWHVAMQLPGLKKGFRAWHEMDATFSQAAHQVTACA